MLDQQSSLKGRIIVASHIQAQKRLHVILKKNKAK
jgi:hypothetical protein